MFVTELSDSWCRYCAGKRGVGLKEEPMGWKVYAICLNDDSNCPDETVGKIPRDSVDHLDGVGESAEALVRNA